MLKTPSEVMLQREMKRRSMAGEPATTPGKSKPKGGRPSRAEASRRALIGIDLTTCDPVAILREIALDRSMPGSTRVSACKALLGLPDGPEGSAADAQTGAISTRALQLLKAARGH
jgi:hypothetical protein